MSPWVWAVGAGTSAFHLATSTIYTYHRDEVYYLASGRRLAWGYVDHPPLTPLLYRLSDTLFGSSPFALRIVPALLHGVIVLLTAWLASELGGGRKAQLIAALAAAVAPMFLTIGHFLTTVSMEVVLWTLAVILLVRILKGGDPRLWLLVGLVIGLAMADKWTTVLLVAGLGAGLLLVPERRVLVTPWVLGGAAVAVAISLPTALWQACHGWPQFEVAGHLRNYGEALASPFFQFVVLGAASVILALPGFLWLLRDSRAEHFRALALAFIVILAIVMVTGGKPYYAAVFSPVLLAAGAACGVGSTGWAVPAWLIGIGILTAPFAMPLLPLSTVNAVRVANKEVGEMVGWPDLVHAVADVYRHYPGATIFTANYSEAGILELLGPGRELPQPVSGHNTYWYWGHPHGRSNTTIVVGYPRQTVEQWFGDVRLAATFHTPGGVHNMEDGTSIWVCHDQRADWAALWPEMRHFQ